jgi:hypothetical protein
MLISLLPCPLTLHLCNFDLTLHVVSLLSNKQTPWPLVRKRTIPTDRPPLVDEI